MAVADLDHDGAKRAAAEIEQRYGSRVLAVGVDITDRGEVEDAVRQTHDALGPIDILVNCAGINNFSPPEEISDAEWRLMFAVNVDGSWNFCRAVMPDMMERRSGKIVNIASGAGVLGMPNAAHYVAAKHAVVGLTRGLAADLGAFNINVNCVCPGPVPATALARRTMNPVFEEESKRRIPLGRLGEPSDIARAVSFLSSSASDWISGVILPVDGGLVSCIRARHWQPDNQEDA